MTETERLAHWQRLWEQHHADQTARLDRIIVGLLELSDDEVAERVRRVLRAVALDHRALETIRARGRRRSRKEKAADLLYTELLADRKTLTATFDQLDQDMYLVARSHEELQGQLLAVVAEAQA